MAKKSDFFTRARANDGVVVKLYLPNGDESGEWLRILGTESDAFREAEVRERQELMRIGEITDEAERKAAANANAKEWNVRLLASLVGAWSFDEPCTQAAVLELFKEAPQIFDKVERVANDRARFFGPRSTSSPPSPSTSSDSPDQPKEQAPASETT